MIFHVLLFQLLFMDFICMIYINIYSIILPVIKGDIHDNKGENVTNR